MKIKCVTALFDIKRDTKGDGRAMNDYLDWFEKTLKLNCDFVIYTEDKFKDFVLNYRKDSKYQTDIIIQKLEEIPYYHKRDLIHDIINSEYYKSKMADLSRIECYLAEYNVIQFSKFGWLNNSLDRHPDTDFIFWIDAGCSRFFNSFNMSSEWPNSNILKTNNLIIQGNTNFIRLFENMEIEKYIWDNNSMVAGTLFGGDRNIIKFLYDEIMKILEDCESKKCVNVDQIALAIFVKKFRDKCDLFIRIDGTHLPLFKFLGEK
jgi:hypothetical protein